MINFDQALAPFTDGDPFEVHELLLTAIGVADRLRPVDDAWADVLAASLGERGLDQPITVRPDPSGEPGTYALVAGMHRLAAAKRLGWLTIPALIKPLNEHEARLVEIDENLIRRELSALDRALFLRERKQVYEAVYTSAKHGGDRRSKIREIEAADAADGIKSQTFRLDPERFTKEAAERTGFSERLVQLAISLADDLAPEVIEKIRTSRIADNQQQLLLLARQNVNDQLLLAASLASGIAPDGSKVGTVAQARVALGLDHAIIDDPQHRTLENLKKLWDRADERTRKAFLKHAKAA